MRRWWSSHGRGACERLPQEWLIDKDTTWSGRMKLCCEVRVAPDATLTLLPGTQVSFGSGGKVAVEGGFVAEGTRDEPIVLSAVEGARWGGIEFDPCSITQRCVLKYCWITFANVAVQCRGGKPKVLLDRFVNDWTAISIESEREGPTCDDLVIERNIFLRDNSAVTGAALRRTIMRHNLVLYCKSGFCLRTGGPDDRVEVTRNVVARCACAVGPEVGTWEVTGNAFVGDGVCIGVSDMSGMDKRVAVDHNLFQGSTVADARTHHYELVKDTEGGGGSTGHFVESWQPRAFESLGEGNLRGEVVFRRADYDRPEGGDWRLAPGSALRGKGRDGGEIGLYPKDREEDADWLPLDR